MRIESRRCMRIVATLYGFLSRDAVWVLSRDAVWVLSRDAVWVVFSRNALYGFLVVMRCGF